MNFECFKNLVVRIARQWFDVARADHRGSDFAGIREYLQESPFTAKASPENEAAYEHLMDARLKLEALSYEIDAHKEAYMGFVAQAMESEELMESLTRGLTKEERHLVELELMILEQVGDWEAGAPGAPAAGAREDFAAPFHLFFFSI